MKKLMLCMLFLGFFIQGHTQIQLKEAKVEYKRTPMKIDPATNSLTIKIVEPKNRDFSKDPLSYVRNNFDVSRLVEENKEAGFSTYFVTFKTSKGHLMTQFDKHGELTSSFQKFKNIALPDEVRLEALRNFEDGRIVSNIYTARSKGWELKQENYILKIKDGEKLRRLKVKKQSGGYVVAVL